MNSRDFFKIFKDIKHRILEEEHDFKELLEDQTNIHKTLLGIVSGSASFTPTYVNFPLYCYMKKL